MARKVYIVQFTHPGGEHTLNRQEEKNYIKEWNYGGHKRKFLKAVGQCVKEDGSLTPKKELLFWGEWEPTSKVKPVSGTEGTALMPKYVHEPFLQRSKGSLILPPYYNSKGKGRQNTDPSYLLTITARGKDAKTRIRSCLDNTFCIVSANRERK